MLDISRVLDSEIKPVKCEAVPATNTCSPSNLIVNFEAPLLDNQVDGDNMQRIDTNDVGQRIKENTQGLDFKVGYLELKEEKVKYCLLRDTLSLSCT